MQKISFHFLRCSVVLTFITTVFALLWCSSVGITALSQAANISEELIEKQDASSSLFLLYAFRPWHLLLLFYRCLACRWPSDTSSVPERPAWNARTSVKVSSCISGGLCTFLFYYQRYYCQMRLEFQLMSFFLTLILILPYATWLATAPWCWDEISQPAWNWHL